MRKTGAEVAILKKYFDESPIWSYEHKVAIAQEVGMTFNQVSKWNWDHRKNLGISTTRDRKKKAPDTP